MAAGKNTKLSSLGHATGSAAQHTEQGRSRTKTLAPPTTAALIGCVASTGWRLAERHPVPPFRVSTGGGGASLAMGYRTKCHDCTCPRPTPIPQNLHFEDRTQLIHS